MEEMNTKRVARRLAVLLVTYFVFPLIQGKTGLHAMAEDEQGMFVPTVDGTWEKKPLHAIKRTEFTRDDASAAKTAATKHRVVAITAGPVREVAVTAAIHKAMPWVASALGLAGLGLVVCGLLARRRLARGQVASSMTRLQIAEAGRTDQRVIRPRLAANLVRDELPRLEASLHEHAAEEQKLRRAA